MKKKKEISSFQKKDIKVEMTMNVIFQAFELGLWYLHSNRKMSRKMDFKIA